MKRGKYYLLFVSFLLTLAMLGCNAFVPEATPEIGDQFHYQFDVSKENPSVGEEITIVATVTNLTGYNYWIKIDNQVCHFGQEDIISSSDFNNTVLFSNDETLTSTFTMTYDAAGQYRVSVNFEFQIDDCGFGYTTWAVIVVVV